MTAPRYENIRAFVHKSLRGSKTNTACAASYERDFSFKLAHILLLACVELLLPQMLTSNAGRRSYQNIVFALLEVAGTGCSTSQCSTILPSASKRNMSTPAVS